MRLIRYADNIIDAMRLYAPDHILLQCLNRDGYACRNTKYVPLTMPDGSIAQVKESRPTDFFRGNARIMNHARQDYTVEKTVRRGF